MESSEISKEKFIFCLYTSSKSVYGLSKSLTAIHISLFFFIANSMDQGLTIQKSDYIFCFVFGLL